MKINKNLIEEIKKIKKEKNAVILGHYYIIPELQYISDYIGDSLQLSQEVAKTNADIIVFLGVNFMAETAKIILPTKKVLIPDINAGCSLSESCKPEDFKKFLINYPNHTVISYINTSIHIKALTDIIVTSSNAKKIIDSLDKNEKIVFAPDRNLGNYINKITNRNMVVWDGACHVHEKFDREAILKIKNQNAEAKIIAHPECNESIIEIADFVGSTNSLLKYVINSETKTFIVVTETGILHQMKKHAPNKTFIAAPSKDNCSDCEYMKLNTLEKLYNCLINETPEINIEEELRIKAEKAIIKMMELS